MSNLLKTVQYVKTQTLTKKRLTNEVINKTPSGHTNGKITLTRLIICHSLLLLSVKH